MLKYRFPCYYFASYIFVSLCHIGTPSVHDQCLRDRIKRLSIYYYYYVYKHFYDQRRDDIVLLFHRQYCRTFGVTSFDCRNYNIIVINSYITRTIARPQTIILLVEVTVCL